MEKRRRLLLTAFVLCFLAWFAIQVLRPHEPVYQGRRLSILLNEAFESGDYEFEYSEPTAKTALRALGPGVLPVLVTMAETRGSIYREILDDFSSEHDFEFLHLPPQSGKPEMAAWGFRQFGAQAKPAVPGLARLLRQKDAWVKADVARCLAAIGPSAQEAVPALLAAFTEHAKGGDYEDELVRDEVAAALAGIGPAARCAIPSLAAITNSTAVELALLQLKGEPLLPVIERLQDTSDAGAWEETARWISKLETNASPAVPYFLNVLTHTNESIRTSAIRALGLIHQQPEVCVTRLVTLLAARDDSSRYAIEALRHFGPAARTAAPEILRCMEESASWMKLSCSNALREIDPHATTGEKTPKPYVVPAGR